MKANTKVNNFIQDIMLIDKDKGEITASNSIPVDKKSGCIERN